MQKKLIALAVAGAMIAPVAMAEVTISGGLQAEIISVSGDDANGIREGLYVTDGLERAFEDPTDPTKTVGGVGSGSYSFLKFSAKEDLGNGMSALAQYNFSVKTDTGIDTRDTFVGLSFSEAATILVGRLSTPYKSSTVGWDPMVATSLQGRGNNGMSILHNGYANNAVAYAGKFGDVKVVAALVVDESADPDDATKTNGKNATSFSVNAPVGPVEVAVAYINVSEFGSISNTGVAKLATDVPLPEDASATKVGVKWSSDAVTVAAQVEMLDKGLTATGDTGNIMYVTGSFKLDEANTISASYGQEDKDVNGGDETGAYMAIAANHAFSKTSSAFVGYMASDDGNDTALNVLSLGARVNF